MNAQHWLRMFFSQTQKPSRRLPNRRWPARLQVESLEDRYVPAPIISVADFNNTNGANPYASLIEDGSGNLFGTTSQGGASGSGTVFEVLKGSRTITTLATFDGTNGANPYGNLALDGSGNLFGTTSAGGTSSLGTVFELPSGSGTITTLATFDGTNGQSPYAGLVLDSSGNLFGTTIGDGVTNFGTVFELPNGSSTITTLATFTGTNGAYPYAGLVEDGSGNLFGTTGYGGPGFSSTKQQYGTVFEVQSGSGMITTLAAFNNTNGAYPFGGVVEDTGGNLFGAAEAGGKSGYGTVFEVKQGSPLITTLATFNYTNGAYPAGPLFEDTSGNLLGAASGGGVSGNGTVFEVMQGSTTITALASFNYTNGSNPQAGLVQDSIGNLFGTAGNGGANGLGTVFEVPVAGPTITTTTLANWIVGQPGYSQTIKATGGAPPSTFSATGTVPPGLTLSSTGVLSGTPTMVGSFNFTVTATDSNGQTGSQSYTVIITFAAPVLGSTMATFPGIQENTPANADPGMTVHDFLSGLSINFQGAGLGMAVTSVDDSHGAWQFSVDGGTTWTLFSSLSDMQALLLADSTTDRIRIVPAANFIGQSQFTFRAWNQTTGTDGAFGNAIPNGGSTAYSTAVGTATISVSPAATDLVGREASGSAKGTLLVSISNGSNGFSAPANWGALAPDVPGTSQWVDVMTGDLNGDGHDDLIGRVLQTGQWFVALSNGSNGFQPTTLWDNWSPQVTWVDVHLADLNGDGKMDLVGRVLQSGEWWVGISTGQSFRTSHWDSWSPAVTWVDVKVGDLTGDGKADLVGRVQSTGAWYVAISTGSGFYTQFWDAWSPAIAWANVQLADLTGNGRADLIGMVPQTGEWWAAVLTGSVFHTSRWGLWDPSAINNLTYVTAGDFTGNGKAGLTGYDAQTGQWFTSVSTGSGLSVPLAWANWDPSQTWVDFQVGDFNGDGLIDVAARDLATGQWQVNLSNGGLFAKSIWVTWDPTIMYVNVNKGNFA